jgi:hypothetical protein
LLALDSTPPACLSRTEIEEGICKGPDVFSKWAIIDGNIAGAAGRTDLLLVFNPASEPNVSKMAMWRLHERPNIKWTDAFIANFGKDYGATIDDRKCDEPEYNEDPVEEDADDQSAKEIKIDATTHPDYQGHEDFMCWLEEQKHPRVARGGWDSREIVLILNARSIFSLQKIENHDSY